jgi:hypothetical protein
MHLSRDALRLRRERTGRIVVLGALLVAALGIGGCTHEPWLSVVRVEPRGETATVFVETGTYSWDFISGEHYLNQRTYAVDYRLVAIQNAHPAQSVSLVGKTWEMFADDVLPSARTLNGLALVADKTVAGNKEYLATPLTMPKGAFFTKSHSAAAITRQGTLGIPTLRK